MRFPTATLGEERALAAVREGAAHYILKDRLQRLVSTVKRALGASAERPRAPPLASVARLASGIAHDVTNVRPPILLGVPLLRAHITAPRRSPAPRDIRKKRRARRRPRPPDPLLRPGASAANPARSRSHRSAATSARSPAKPFPPTSAATPASAPTFGPSPPAPPKSTQASSISGHRPRRPAPRRPSHPPRGKPRPRRPRRARHPRRPPRRPPGPALVRQVEDTGTGILPDVLAQIGDACDPTKQNGKGTGQATDLGLSTVRGMVAPHGFVTVQSQAAAAPPSAFSTPRPKAPSARRPSPPPSPSSTATANSASSSSPK